MWWGELFAPIVDSELLSLYNGVGSTNNLAVCHNHITTVEAVINAEMPCKNALRVGNKAVEFAGVGQNVHTQNPFLWRWVFQLTPIE